MRTVEERGEAVRQKDGLAYLVERHVAINGRWKRSIGHIVARARLYRVASMAGKTHRKTGTAAGSTSSRLRKKMIVAPKKAACCVATVQTHRPSCHTSDAQGTYRHLRQP